MIHRLLAIAAAALLLGAPASAQGLRIEHSIVDYLTHKRQDPSYRARFRLWDKHFPREHSEYRGSKVQNMRLLEVLRLDAGTAMPEACRLQSNVLLTPKGLKVATIDKRPPAKRDDLGGFYVIFSSRPLTPGSPGHAWVSFAMSDHDVPKLCVARTFGNFPKKGEKAWTFGKVPGRVLEGWTANLDCGKEAHRLIVRIDSETYVQARRVLEQWSTRKKYELLKLDCTNFAKQVAKAIGLEVNKSRFPNVFVSELLKDNAPRR